MSSSSGATAAAVAQSVRSGATKAADIVEQHLANITGREPEIHAFNLVPVSYTHLTLPTSDLV